MLSRRHLPARTVVALLAALGAALLVAAELSDLLEVRAGREVLERQVTGAHHAYAQLVIAVGALALGAVAFRTAARPPLAALAALGLASLLVTVVVDLPDTRATGLTGGFAPARASAEVGLWLELAGGGVLLAAGVAGATRARSSREREGA